ncbi:helix-turn-helix domain-containing protein [Streptomyces zaomyceticus]|uniref:helix-turn-helix domain-containing protein n=1 Tax=Streptomyces zaomyceticus TaxID=68286 RepID=UPI003717B5E5
MRIDSTPVQHRPPLRAVRAARGMGLREVAERAGIDPGHLSKVERGQKQLSVDSLHRLAAVLGLHELASLLTPYVQKAQNSDAAGGATPTASSDEPINESTAKKTGENS